MTQTTKLAIAVAIIGIAVVAYLASRPRTAIVDTTSSEGPDTADTAASRAVRGYGAAATEIIASSVALAG